MKDYKQIEGCGTACRLAEYPVQDHPGILLADGRSVTFFPEMPSKEEHVVIFDTEGGIEATHKIGTTDYAAWFSVLEKLQQEK